MLLLPSTNPVLDLNPNTAQFAPRDAVRIAQLIQHLFWRADVSPGQMARLAEHTSISSDLHVFVSCGNRQQVRGKREEGHTHPGLKARCRQTSLVSIFLLSFKVFPLINSLCLNLSVPFLSKWSLQFAATLWHLLTSQSLLKISVYIGPSYYNTASLALGIIYLFIYFCVKTCMIAF